MYRISTHELGGISFVKDVENYSVKQLYDVLEVLDVYDAIKKSAYDKIKAESVTK